MVEPVMKMTKSGILGLCFLAIGALSAVQAQSNETQLMKEASVTKRQAENIALTKVPHGTIKAGELEKEHGHLVWSFDIAKPATQDITEVQVDARSGKIVLVQNETPTQQAAEARADKAKH